MKTGAQTLEAALGRGGRRAGPLERQRPWRVETLGLDLWISVAVLALLGIGVVMVFNVSYFHAERDLGDPYYFFRKHVVAVVMGLVGAVVVARLSSDVYQRLAYPAVIVALLSLVAVLAFGTVRGGAQRWLVLGTTSVQPSELAKVALILYLACSLAQKRDRLADFRRGVLPHCMVGGVMAALLVVEPDFGSAALCIGLVGFMLFAGGARLAHLGLLASGAIPVLAYAVLSEGYRMGRLLSFLNPGLDPQGAGYQLDQSLIAFGSGGVTGLGLGGSQQKMYFLPAAHTDFIYSIVGEELGAVGALLVLGLFAILAFRGLRIASRHPDRFGSLLAAGVTLLIVVQALLNIGVVLGCLPTKGLVLPFISYGGSAMLVTLVEVGILLALARETR
jgi:cell division protein FtsW